MPLPNPRKNEKKEEFISRFMSNQEAKKEFPDKKQRLAVANSKFKTKQMTKLNFNYHVPINISESLGENPLFTIEGIAINSTLTDNNHRFLPEELRKAASTLTNRPLLKDHDNSVNSVVGKVLKAEFSELSENIRFKAQIMDENIQKMIKDGRLNTVSIGANVKEIDEEEGELIPRGILFKELSIVAVPADEDAQFSFTGKEFSLALKESYKLEKEKIKEKEKKKEKELKLETPDVKEGENKEQLDLTEEISDKNDLVVKQELNEDKQMEKDKNDKNEVSELKEDVKVSENDSKLSENDSKLSENDSKLSEEVNALKALVSEMIAKLDAKEADADEEKEEKEEKVEEPEPKSEPEESKEEVKTESEEEDEEDEEDEEEDETEESSGYKIIEGYKSFTVERDLKNLGNGPRSK